MPWRGARLLTSAVLTGCAACLVLFMGGEAKGEDWKPLAQEILRRVDQPKFASAIWGVHVIDLATGETVVSTNAGKLLKPASVAKLFTGAATLLELGSEHRIRTSVYGRLGRTGRAIGPLTLYGRGDPSLNSRFLSAGSNELRDLAGQLQRQGLRSVRDGITADETHFDSLRYGSGWTWDDTQYWYGAPVSALSVYDNFVLARVFPSETLGGRASVQLESPRRPFEIQNYVWTAKPGSRGSIEYAQGTDGELTFFGNVPADSAALEERVPVPTPAAWAAALFRNELQTAGVSVRGRDRVRSRPPGAPFHNFTTELTELAFIESPPVRDLLRPMFWGSNNLYAQALLLQLGAGDRRTTTERAGVERMLGAMERLGIAPHELRLDEGTGLSRAALVTPRSVVQLLVRIRETPIGDDFFHALPVGGQDGLLANRLLGTRARIRGKSGSYRHVSTLAGYARTTEGVEVAFAFFLNNFGGNTAEARSEVDALAALLTGRQE